jgi:4-amino-4-deoxy-L-arabinose transferase-like glycosyltransferase
VPSDRPQDTMTLTAPPEAPARHRRDGAWLALILLVAALAYSVRMDSLPLEPYYAAAVRAMSGSWHDFVFGAFDPDGTVSLDKLPGAFWLQALSVRVFGLHTWSIVLPQVVEGVLAVFVLFRVVRRAAGPGAGLVAAALLALSPAVVALDRGNISDSLMILLVLLAADAVGAAARDGRWWRLALAGLWVGLAFQAKMIEAWLVLPALAAAHLLAAPGPVSRRLGQLLLGGAVTAVVSLAWMSVVSALPAASRPYVDGSTGDSVYEQVFGYNGLGRVGEGGPLATLIAHGIGLALTGGRPGPSRLFSGDLGHDIGWLLPAALVVAVAGLVGARGRERTDPVRAGYLMWGLWLVVLAAAFSTADTVNAYYTAALAPAIAALLGLGVADLRRLGTRPARVLAAVLVVGSAGYAVWLLHDGSPLGVPRLLGPAVLVLGMAAAAVLVWSRLGAGLAVAAVALLVAPVLGGLELVARGAGALDAPFESLATAKTNYALFVATPRLVARSLPGLERAQGGAPTLMAAQSAAVASVFSYPSGREVLPIGGFTGTQPTPTVPQLRDDVARGRFHLAVTFTSSDPRITWIATHCHALNRFPKPFHDYYCTPPDAAH